MKLGSQLVMTPQLQLAISLLSKPHAEVATLLAQHAAGLRELGADETDPLDARELEDAREDERAPWLWQRLPMLERVEGQPEADVWLTGDPLVATANGTLPRYATDASTTREVAWVLRAVRQRSRTFETIAAVLVAENEVFLRTGDGKAKQLRFSEAAQRVGMHASTIERVCSVGVMQSARGFTSFASLTR